MNSVRPHREVDITRDAAAELRHRFIAPACARPEVPFENDIVRGSSRNLEALLTSAESSLGAFLAGDVLDERIVSEDVSILIVGGNAEKSNVDRVPSLAQATDFDFALPLLVYLDV